MGHVNTVDDNKEEYTKCEYHNAILASKIQNIIMFPGVWAYTMIVDSKLIANCPIRCANIAAAECIFGPNLGALKGKTTKQASMPIIGWINGVQPSILEQYQQVVLMADIMFINKIPFLITTSCGLPFSTIEALPNHHPHCGGWPHLCHPELPLSGILHHDCSC